MANTSETGQVCLGKSDRALAIVDDVLVLTDEDGVVLMVKQEGEFRRVVTQPLKIVVAPDRFMRAAYDGSDVQGLHSRFP